MRKMSLHDRPPIQLAPICQVDSPQVFLAYVHQAIPQHCLVLLVSSPLILCERYSHQWVLKLVLMLGSGATAEAINPVPHQWQG
jgi:hypothetical protein